ncbi:MAG: hypothetical protein IJU53_05705 [Thermoguttaceae bacterium]|nr:hypothetical protein [Thermoguttaceae bacterium]
MGIECKCLLEMESGGSDATITGTTLPASSNSDLADGFITTLEASSPQILRQTTLEASSP